jgi:hypothetical protein
MGQVGAAGDNAAMESFFALLQKNVLDRQVWATRQDSRRSASARPSLVLDGGQTGQASLASAPVVGALDPGHDRDPQRVSPLITRTSARAVKNPVTVRIERGLGHGRSPLSAPGEVVTGGAGRSAP